MRIKPLTLLQQQALCELILETTESPKDLAAKLFEKEMPEGQVGDMFARFGMFQCEHCLTNLLRLNESIRGNVCRTCYNELEEGDNWKNGEVGNDDDSD